MTQFDIKLTIIELYHSHQLYDCNFSDINYQHNQCMIVSLHDGQTFYAKTYITNFDTVKYAIGYCPGLALGLISNISLCIEYYGNL